MVSTPRAARAARQQRSIARAAMDLVLAAALTLALPAAMAMAQDEATLASSPTPSAKPVPLDEGSRPVRVRVPYFDIDLPVVWSGRTVAGNPAGYPLCDVAQYLTDTDQELVLPGQPGTSWIYGHAQPGMLLPLTESWFTNRANELQGKLIKLQLRDGRLLTYRISTVDVAFDYGIAERPDVRQQRLVLQTSTGTTGDSPRLLVAGRMIDAEWTDEPRPEANPRACWQAPRPTPKGAQASASDRNTPRPTPAPVAEPDEPEGPTDTLRLVLGSGAVLLGATVVAVYVARRP